MIPDFRIKQEVREKKGFNASDFGKMGFDLYHAWKGTPHTNPTKWNDTLKFGAGKGVELQMVKVLKDSGIVAPDFDQEKDETFEMEREGIKVRMKIDAFVGTPLLGDLDSYDTTVLFLLLKRAGIKLPEFESNCGLVVGAPIEIKSINNKNSIDIAKYADGNPRENYVGQLAIYMDYLNIDVGYLFVASVDGLAYFFLTCRKLEGEGKRYQCGNTIVDIGQEYKRWAGIYNEYVLKNIEPDPFEAGRYKTPIKDIDWLKVKTSKISDARNGHAVIGDEGAWQILYSPWKDLIIERQGATVGYTVEEIEEIKIKTAGYSSKLKK